ncbi:LPS export ABC transporter ATP-binding protein [Altererythrobacter lutimaris]|uniref:LPS export ABC transporter ATP-binding protein n=1 Tax=Altererythrobacter lutimaris TaxID=2743979 RepID=A0A850H9L8_9SPHN|nr:LPS export ABC transporter ATP-binding protein [Altererythrobacter lutimaris]NVE96024.1 LPS export ABC transporter ATP-binding protein [Altererythrobacter lutimaris]
MNYDHELSARRPEVAAVSSVLEVVEIYKAFGRREVLEGVSLRVEQGQVVGLFGRDGAGKTVTFYCILGLVKCDAGRITLNGHDISRIPFYRRALLGLGYLPEQPSIFRGLTVAGNIRSMLEVVEPNVSARDQRLEELLSDLRIEHLRDAPATSLSGGERRRCEVARALALDPAFILLDEPFAGIDPLTIASIKEMILDFKRRGIGVLITDQNVPEMVEVIDCAYLLDEGSTVFSGSPEQLLHDETVIARYLGRDALSDKHGA